MNNFLSFFISFIIYKSSTSREKPVQEYEFGGPKINYKNSNEPIKASDLKIFKEKK